MHAVIELAQEHLQLTTMKKSARHALFSIFKQRTLRNTISAAEIGLDGFSPQLNTSFYIAKQQLLFIILTTTPPKHAYTHLHGLVNGDVGKQRLFHAFEQMSEEGHNVEPHAFRVLGGVGGRSECSRRGVRVSGWGGQSARLRGWMGRSECKRGKG